VNEALVSVGDADLDRDRRMAIELDVRDSDEIVAAWSIGLRYDHRNVVRLDDEVLASDARMLAGDTKVTAVDGVHGPS
jgi:hypothetical protein